LTNGAAAALDALEADGRGERVVVPISARALAGTQASDRTLDPLKAVERARRAYLIAEVFDLPRRVSLEALENVTVPLLPYVGGYLARPPDWVDDYTVFANCNYLGVTAALDGRADADAHLTRVWAGAEKNRLALFVSGVETEETKAACVRYGARGVSGPLIGPRSEQP
jgi:hypothetical protein